MREFKVIKTNHSYSNLKDGSAYAIVISTFLIAEPDAVRSVNLEDPADMYIIAKDIVDAALMLNKHLSATIGRK